MGNTTMENHFMIVVSIETSFLAARFLLVGKGAGLAAAPPNKETSPLQAAMRAAILWAVELETL
jgi:hypothetical protein